MKKDIYTLAGSALSLLSAAAAGYALGKKKKETCPASAIILGAFGIAAGALITQIPKIVEFKQKLVVKELLDDEDADLIEENISELLGNSVDER